MRVTNLLREDVTCPLAPGSVNNIVSADMISTGVLLHPYFRIVFVVGFVFVGCVVVGFGTIVLFVGFIVV